tara:strand:+ start:57 stop:263 length:207 start_codon:yes stop_codon:yes gene_type:complete
MPTLDDAPTKSVPKLATADLLNANAGDASKIASQDLIQIYDQSEQVAKTITVADLAAAITTGTLTATS